MQHLCIIIPGQLPGLNEYVSAERTNRYKAASLKRQTEQRIQYAVKLQARGKRFTKPVIMRYRWYEKNRKRDKDNVAFAKKFVQDALVHSGVLENDGWKNIDHFTDEFFVDAQNPRVEVEIEEADEDAQV